MHANIHICGWLHYSDMHKAVMNFTNFFIHIQQQNDDRIYDNSLKTYSASPQWRHRQWIAYHLLPLSVKANHKSTWTRCKIARDLMNVENNHRGVNTSNFKLLVSRANVWRRNQYNMINSTFSQTHQIVGNWWFVAEMWYLDPVPKFITQFQIWVIDTCCYTNYWWHQGGETDIFMNDDE